MKIAVTGDSHLGRTLYGFDLTSNIRRTMYRFFRWCANQKVDAVVHLGDVGDRPVWSEHQQKILIQWCNEFERAELPLFLLTGNHDVLSKHGVASALDIIKTARHSFVNVVDRPQHIMIATGKGVDWAMSEMLFLPFPSPSIYREDEDWIADIKAAQSEIVDSCVCFAHLNVDGARMGEQEVIFRGADYTIPDRILDDDRIRLVVNGHIHKPQKVGKVLMPGAAERLNFSERNNDVRFICIDTESLDVKKYKIKQAYSLIQIDIDASGWAYETPLTTEDVLADLGDVPDNCLIKVQPFVDEQTTIDWPSVENTLYNKDAVYVVIAPPVLAQRKRKKSQGTLTSDSPMGLAKRFLRRRVHDKAERLALLKMFKRLQVSDSEKKTTTSASR